AIVGWQTATRDDRAVAAALHETRTLDEVHALDETAFFDELFQYIRQIGAWSLLEDLDPDKRTGALYPFLQFVLVTIMRCVGGVQSMLATQDVLLTDEGLMGLLGFNATQVKQGATARGLDRCTEPVEVRGAFSYETVADGIVSIGKDRLAAMFNGAIRRLAAHGLFAKKLDVVLDATDDEATPGYKTDEGGEVPHVVRDKRPEVRANRHASKVEVRVWGWKIWVVWEAQAKVPLAIAIDDINAPDNLHALAVLQQAQANVKDYATIRSVALDRGFLDGKLLWAIDKDHLLVYIPAKSTMRITGDAREIARRAQAEAGRGRTLDGCCYRERHETRCVGAGKNAREQTYTTTLVGIRDLPCDWWNEEGSTSKSNAKSFEPKRLRATVVLRWDGAPKDADKEVVILTTDPSDDPFVAFDAYDDRSLIENSCNREAKEHWFLEHHPKRSEAGVRVHAYFVFLCMALVAGFRAEKTKSDEAERRGQDIGITRYRRAQQARNRDKVAVFIGGHYGIFRSYEFAVLVGVTVRDLALRSETRDGVLARFGIPPANTS
ncbi:MAG: hypothetical protein WCJ30_03680, partial [Deltaproteobacteria bacterium]